ncbi:putative DNA repair protein RadC [Magnetofaba australis IT-1]|uniref:Putative DNA repair protein RadC n=1 Tax=Magnetofaba australis IT-1 TaxID=1434232 RepID=A0A1Y2K185_9PROT|nr:putative DNA repair protein RadC [Magnetofaba australis IT-1]
MRKRFLLEGLDGFEDHQALELALFTALPRRDTNVIAHALLKRFGSFAAVLDADPGDLASVEGMGQGAAAFLSLIPALTRRYLHDKATHDKARLDQPEAAAKILVPMMAGRTEEVFYVLCLDTQNRLLFPALISEGTVKQTAVHPRQVVEEVVRHRAASVILSHNHPSGAAKPSKDDISLTARLHRVLEGIEVRLLDHVIVAGESSYSFAQNGMLPRADGLRRL